MKFLLTGKNGQLGFELQRSLAPLGDIVAVGAKEADLADPAAVRNLARRVRPDIIVNSGAYTAVDKAESDQATAFAINANAPGILSQEAARLGALMVHYSTDYVFDGRKVAPYCETDSPDPQSIYGRSKFEGEMAVARANPRFLILRTSWLAGANGGNFAKTILRLAAERQHLDIVADQFGAPTSAALLADVTAQVVRQYQLAGPEKFSYGTYHVAAGGETNWSDYARFVIAQALANGKALKARPQDVRSIASADYPTAATRPANSRLDTRHFRNTFGLRLPEWQEGIRHMLQQIL